MHKNQTCWSNYSSVEGGFVPETVCKLDDELKQFPLSAVEIAKGLTDDRRDSGPSAAILLHNASQLLITSVNLPLSSPISTCNEWTARTFKWKVSRCSQATLEDEQNQFFTHSYHVYIVRDMQMNQDFMIWWAMQNSYEPKDQRKKESSLSI